MNFIKKYKEYFAQTLLVLFVTSTVILPTLAPVTALAQTEGQSLTEATKNGLDDSSYAPKSGCFQKDNFDTNSIAGCVAVGTYYLIFKPTYWLAGWMGLFFNFALNELVMGMGDLVQSMDGIMTAWKTIRDVTNVFLVFLTVYIGIATILGISGFGAKQMLWKVVLAALLVNFSVTFTKVVIDISNLTAIQTFLMFQSKTTNVTENCAHRSRVAGANSTSLNTDSCITHGIATAFWTKLRITSIFNFQGMKTASNSTTAGTQLYWNMAFTYVMAAIMFIVLAFVFGGAGFLFVARFIILVFLLIVSPLALVLWITGVSDQGRIWWHSLIKQSIFPPAILLCWWIAYVILGDYTDSYSRDATIGTAGAVTPSAISIATMFIIVIGFLIAGLILANKLGAHGANAVLKTGEKWSRGLAIGTGSLVAAHTLGRASAYAQRKYAEDMAEANRMENGKYVNKSPMAKLKRGLSGGRIDRGLNATVGAGAGMKFGGSSFAERKLSNTKNSDARLKELNETGRDIDLKEAMGIINSKYYAENQKTAHDIAKRKIASASQAEIERLRANSGRADTPQMINTYSKKQASALAAKESATPMQKRQLTEAAFKQEREALRTVDKVEDPDKKEAYIKTLRSMSSSDIKENAETLADNPSAVAHMTHQTFKQIKENKDDIFDATKISEFVEARRSHFESLKGDALKKEIQITKPADLAEHDVSFFQRADVVKNLDPETLTGMVRTGLSQEKREAMRVAVESEYAKIPIQQRSEPSKILDPKTQKPVSNGGGAGLTPQEQNIVKLHNWFNNNNRMNV